MFVVERSDEVCGTTRRPVLLRTKMSLSRRKSLPRANRRAVAALPLEVNPRIEN
jgi:hypothetical protein